MDRTRKSWYPTRVAAPLYKATLTASGYTDATTLVVKGSLASFGDGSRATYDWDGNP